MRDRKTLFLSFVLGLFSFTVPAAMLLARSPVVETTNFRMSPSTVQAGQRIEAIWTDRTMRVGCEGIVFRRFIGGDETWIFQPVSTAHHGFIGETQTFHTEWIVPHMPIGKSVFHKDVKRWCNVFQEWLWPMHETQEAEFTVVE